VVTENDTPPPTDTSSLFGEPRVYSRETLGAYRRRTGQPDGLCEEARVTIAYEAIQQARRNVMLDRLEGCFSGLQHHAEPEHVARRLRRLADQIDPYYDCTCQANWHPWCPVHQRPWDPDAA
jgi:hypothetical protein